MNYAVHALMYFYYFLMAVKCKPKWLNAFWITIAQISQMVVGVAVTVLGFIAFKRHGENCTLSAENNTAAFVMYGSYLFLFVQFFVQRYFKQQHSKSAAKATAQNGIHKEANGTEPAYVPSNGDRKPKSLPREKND